MIYKIECSCGHIEKFNLYGEKKKRDWIAEQKSYERCSECKRQDYLEQFEKEKVKAAAKAKELELPELTGNEKQIEWAETIRQKWINWFENKIIWVDKDEKTYILEDKSPQNSMYDIADNTTIINTMIENFKDSKFYIDNRDSFSFVKMEIYKLANLTENQKAEKEMLKVIEAELTIKPENSLYKESAKIKIDKIKNVIEIYFSKNNDFIEIVKSFGFRWYGVWQKDIYWHSGKIEDRAIEIGNVLLNNGFPITMDNKELLDNAINGVFEPEQMRIVFVQENSDKLSIWNKKRNDKIYKIAKSIKSAKWISPTLQVKVDYYKEILDFAELYDFVVDDSAKNLIEQYKEESKKVKIVSPTKIEEKETNDNALENILQSSDLILSDLIDE